MHARYIFKWFFAPRRLDLALCVLYKGLGNFGCRAPARTYMYSDSRWLAHFRCRFIGGVVTCGAFLNGFLRLALACASEGGFDAPFSLYIKKW